jgi:protoporphyrinogen oxidase
MVPYNEKLARVPVSTLTCEWIGRFVPRPTRDEILAGAYKTEARQTGYNKRFLYPREGGIQALWRSIAKHISGLELSQRVVKVDVASNTVTTLSGQRHRYREALVSSLPLPAMIKMSDLPDCEKHLADQLRSNNVTCVNVGLRRTRGNLDGYHWTYLPEAKYAAYRIGFYSGFAPLMAPPGGASVYVEISHGAHTSTGALVDAAVDDLLALGVIATRRDIEVVVPVSIPGAYVIHDAICAPTRRVLHQRLERENVFMVGRYGRWEYASMEDAMWQGLTAIDGIVHNRLAIR